MEFKVGGKVWESGRGNGIVTSIDDGGNRYPIEVDFDGNHDECYTLDGKRYDNHPYRSLFHGHNLKVVGEVVPVECWLIKYSNGVLCDRTFTSEEKAECYNACDGGATYHKVTI